MNLNATPSGERVHIGIFGKRNAGKSSLINALTGQNLAITSETKGTTTDPVSKAMELLPLGPIMVIDTPGIDDDGELGKLRVEKAYQVLNKTHIALLVVDATLGLSDEDKALWSKIEEKKLPGFIVFNKIELISEMQQALLTVDALKLTKSIIFVSAEKKTNIHELKEKIAALTPKDKERALVSDLVEPQDVVILVTPIDESAPKGRMILPQQQVMRDLLDHQAITLLVQPQELIGAISKLSQKPKLVITDSQAFGYVNKVLPRDIPLTSFSILMARYKGNLEDAVRGVKLLNSIKDGDLVLISEGCTHHRQCNDIGSVKLPGWIKNYTGVTPEFAFTSGGEFPSDLSPYKLIIHCGACMLNEKEMLHRYGVAKTQSIPITNYGIAIAQMHGILARSLEPLPEIAKLLK
ncbi:MAG: [FeFe] hydrogenase H-cluster maturation GTPase HydF [Phascolarctobacterium sp.]|nr:[FeFe] hydrogenase H-cluster maturation GTPase HydF [Phascolarctobacterium sp.]